MSELLTQSRPYAEAIFEIAKEENALDLWVSDLTLVAISMQEVEVKRLIDSPDISQKIKAETFAKLFEGEISNKVLNFVLVSGTLCQNMLQNLHRGSIEIEDMSLQKLETYKRNLRSMVGKSTPCTAVHVITCFYMYR